MVNPHCRPATSSERYPDTGGSESGKADSIDIARVNRSAAHFENQVERRFSGPAEVREIRLAEHVGKTRLACLGAQDEMSAF